MKVLITVPDLKKIGGVTALFNILKMEQHFENVSLFILSSTLPTILRIPLKYIDFVTKLKGIDVVHLNPSLNKKSFLRDAGFAWLTILFSRKLIVYWHGWEEEYEEKIKTNKLLRFINKHTFLKANTTIVLGTIFKAKWIDLGYKNKIIIETNSAENKYITEITPKLISKDEKVRLLFLSRLELKKGVYVAIETLKLLNKKENRYILIIAGSGGEEEKVKSIISDHKEIEWAGYVTNDSKHNLLATSHIMFFPSYYSEGLPLTLLESMMYGLPIISRPVGGIPDIINNNVNGYLTESLQPEEYCKMIHSLVNDPNQYEQMSLNNLEKSKVFNPQAVRSRIYKVYEETFKSILG